MKDAQVAVLLENIEGQIQILAESMSPKFDAVSQRFDGLDQRLSKLELTTGQIFEVVSGVPSLEATVIDHNDRLLALQMPPRA